MPISLSNQEVSSEAVEQQCHHSHPICIMEQDMMSYTHGATPQACHTGISLHH